MTLIPAAAAAILVLLHPGISSAIPAYARRYDVQCTTCHGMLPPRLNNIGMLYRKSGLRLPDADENGKLKLRQVEATGIGDAMSLSVEFTGHHLDRSEVAGTTENRTSMQMGELALVAGTAIGDHYSANMVFLPRNDEGDPEFEAAEIQANCGTAERQLYARAGLTETLAWQKANEGSLTLTAPLEFDEVAPGAVGTFGGFPLGLKQTLFEVGAVEARLRNGKLQSTMLSAAALNGVTQDPATGEVTNADTNPAGGTDVLLQATELYGDRHTLGVFYYGGRTILDTGLGPFRDRFHRMGIVGSVSPVERVDLLGGLVSGRDKSQELGDVAVKSLGWYAEGNVEIRPHWIGVYRYDRADPNTDASGDLRRAHTISTTAQVENYLFLTLEYQQRIEADDSKPHDFLGRIRLVY